MATICKRLHTSRAEFDWISRVVAKGHSGADWIEGADAGKIVSYQRDIRRHVQWPVCEVFVAQGHRVVSASSEKVKRTTRCSGHRIQNV